jgi:hypothetical protein
MTAPPLWFTIRDSPPEDRKAYSPEISAAITSLSDALTAFRNDGFSDLPSLEPFAKWARSLCRYPYGRFKNALRVGSPEWHELRIQYSDPRLFLERKISLSALAGYFDLSGKLLSASANGSSAADLFLATAAHLRFLSEELSNGHEVWESHPVSLFPLGRLHGRLLAFVERPYRSIAPYSPVGHWDSLERFVGALGEIGVNWKRFGLLRRAVVAVDIALAHLPTERAVVRVRENLSMADPREGIAQARAEQEELVRAAAENGLADEADAIVRAG